MISIYQIYSCKIAQIVALNNFFSPRVFNRSKEIKSSTSCEKLGFLRYDVIQINERNSLHILICITASITIQLFYTKQEIQVRAFTDEYTKLFLFIKLKLFIDTDCFTS